MSERGVGMPHTLTLHMWARELANIFGTHSIYQVGSSLQKRDYHDVDVRVLLEDDEYDRWFAPCPSWRNEHASPRWVGVTLAFTQWGREVTGLRRDALDRQPQRRVTPQPAEIGRS